MIVCTSGCASEPVGRGSPSATFEWGFERLNGGFERSNGGFESSNGGSNVRMGVRTFERGVRFRPCITIVGLIQSTLQ